MKSQKGQVYQTSYYPYVFKFSLFYFTVFGLIAFLFFIWFDDFGIVSKGNWPYSSWYYLWSLWMPNVYFFLILVGFLSLWFVNLLTGRRYKLSENGFYHRWFPGKECFTSWDEIKSIEVRNDFGYWRVILKKKHSKSLFHLLNKSFFFRVNVPMSCEFKREVKRHIPNDLQPEFPKQSLSSLISERITEKIWNFVNKFSKIKKENNKNSDLFYRNLDFFYNFKSGLQLAGFMLFGILFILPYILLVLVCMLIFIWFTLTGNLNGIKETGNLFHDAMYDFIYSLMTSVSAIPGIIIIAFLIGFIVLLFFTSNYKLTNDGFYYKCLLRKKEHFIPWKKVGSITVFYEFGFLNVYIFLKKKSFIDKSFLFLVKKNIGEEPELGLKKYIPSNIKLKYSKTTSSWHTLCLMMNTLKSLSFKKTQTLITKGKICFIWMILISGTFLIWILVTCIFIRPCFFF